AKSDEIRCRGQFDAAVKLLETAWKSAADSGDRFESGVRYISCLMSKNDRAKAIAIINDIAKSPDLDRDQLTAVANYQK
ncbi:tetratricopeptide repeat protein, partial [Pseudomonas sp. FW306-2-11AD]|uniref:tetratricopeptide repeat protein n=1 Tax=Pseudomonas sp. FW306-2-11AD TaxID=2070665 RepID=UPI000CB3CF2F